jgi:hypothetical protein
MARFFIPNLKIDTYQRMPMRTKLSTWDGKFEFEYERDTDGAITISHGEKSEYTLVLEALLYNKLIRTFAGKTVRVNHCLAEENIEDWLTNTGSRAGISQYLASIVRHEGYAVEGCRRGTIAFR